LTAAEQLRGRIVGDSTAYRLVYSDSDLLPSLIIDRYRDCFVIQTLSQGMEALKQTWCDLLIERYAPRSIVERNDSRVRDLEGLPRRAGFLYGEDSGEVAIEEAALTSGGPATLKFTVDLVHGQKTGAFLDQRENRLAAETYARGKALDCFTGEGGFALHLARHAEQVTAIDISAASLERAALNAALNQRSNVEFVEANVFDWLRQTCNSDRRFDLIVLDPPAFAKNRASIQGAYRGYKEINLRALKLLNRGGILITCSCSHHISELDFLNILASAAADARRAVRIIEKRGQARDHPVLISMPETYYLKCVILEVV
jgi:23S rRNA (cytosine1962-C5)-methyltransferase